MDLPATQAIDEEEEFGPSQPFDDDENNKAVLMGTLQIGNKSYSIVSGITLIGRNPVCKIVINHETVSKKHAEIEAGSSDGTIFIRDLMSCNKTKINNTRLRPNTSYQIKNGDTLSFGKIEGIFKSHIIEDSFVLCTPQVNRSTKPIIPGTPDSSMNISSTSENDVSTIPGTQTDDIEKCFRRPEVPIKPSISSEEKSSTILTVSIDNIQSSLLNDKSRKSDFSEVETQRFSDATNEDMCNSIFTAETYKVNFDRNKSDDLDEDICELETQRPLDIENLDLYHSNFSRPEFDKEKSNIVSIHNIETDKNMSTDTMENIEIPFNDSILSSDKNKFNDNSVYNAETQKFVAEEVLINSIEDLETQAYTDTTYKKSNDLLIYSAQTQKHLSEAAIIESLNDLETQKFDNNVSDSIQENSINVSIYSAATQKNLHESNTVQSIENLETQPFNVTKSVSEKRNSFNVSIYSAETQKNNHESSNLESIENCKTQGFNVRKSILEKRNSFNVSIYSAETQKNTCESSNLESIENLETQQFDVKKSDLLKTNSNNVSINSTTNVKNIHDLSETESIENLETQQFDTRKYNSNENPSIDRWMNSTEIQQNESITPLEGNNLQNVMSDIVKEELNSTSNYSAKEQTHMSDKNLNNSLEPVDSHELNAQNSLKNKLNESLHDSKTNTIINSANKSTAKDKTSSFIIDTNSEINDEDSFESQSFKNHNVEDLQTSLSNEKIIKKSLQNLNDENNKNLSFHLGCDTAKSDSNQDNTNNSKTNALKNDEASTFSENKAFLCSSNEKTPSTSASDAKPEESIIEDDDEEEIFCSQNLIEHCSFALRLDDSQIHNQSVSKSEKSVENVILQNQNCTDHISNKNLSISEPKIFIKNNASVIADSDSETDEEGIFSNNLSKEDNTSTSKDISKINNKNNKNVKCGSASDDEGIFSNHVSRDEHNKLNKKDIGKNLTEVNEGNNSKNNDNILHANNLFNEGVSKMCNINTLKSSRKVEENAITYPNDVFDSTHYEEINNTKNLEENGNRYKSNLSGLEIDKNISEHIENIQTKSTTINFTMETDKLSITESVKTEECKIEAENMTPIRTKNVSQVVVTKVNTPQFTESLKINQINSVQSDTSKSSIIKKLEHEVILPQVNYILDTAVEEQKLASLKRHSVSTEITGNNKIRTSDDSNENTDLDSTIERNLDEMFDGPEEKLKEENSSILTQQLENILEDSQINTSEIDLNTSTQSPTLGTKRYSSKLKNRRRTTPHINANEQNPLKMPATNLNDTLELNLNELFDNNVNSVESYKSESIMTQQLESVLQSQESNEVEKKEIITEKESFSTPKSLERKNHAEATNIQSNISFDKENITSRSKLNESKSNMNSQDTEEYSANLKSVEKCKMTKKSKLDDDKIGRQLFIECEREIIYKRGTLGFSDNKQPVSTKDHVAFLECKSTSCTSDSQSDNEETNNDNLTIRSEINCKKRLSLSLNKNVDFNLSQSSAHGQQVEKEISTEKNDHHSLIHLSTSTNAIQSSRTEQKDSTSLPMKRVQVPGIRGFSSSGSNKYPVESEELVSAASSENEDLQLEEAALKKVSTDNSKQQITTTTSTKTEVSGLSIVRSKRSVCSGTNDSQNVPPKRMKTDGGERHKLQELSVLISPLREKLISNRYYKRNESYNLKSNFKQPTIAVEQISDNKRPLKSPKALDNFVIEKKSRTKTDLLTLSTTENSITENQSNRTGLRTRSKAMTRKKKTVDPATDKEKILLKDTDIKNVTQKLRTRDNKAPRQQSEVSAYVKVNSSDDMIEYERSEKMRTQFKRQNEKKTETKIKDCNERKQETSVVQDSDLEQSNDSEITTNKDIKTARLQRVKSLHSEKDKSDITTSKGTRSRQAKTAKNFDCDQGKQSEITIRKSTRSKKKKEFEDFDTEHTEEPEISNVKVSRYRRGKVVIQSTEAMSSENKDDKERIPLDTKAKSSRSTRQRHKSPTTGDNLIELKSGKDSQEMSDRLKNILSESKDNDNINIEINKINSSRPGRKIRKRAATSKSKTNESSSEESQEDVNTISDIPVRDTEKRTRYARTRIAKGNYVNSSEENKTSESSKSISDDVFEKPSSRAKRARLNKSNTNKSISENKVVSDTDLKAESIAQQSSTSRRKKTTSVSATLSRSRRSICTSPMKGSPYKVLFTGEKSEVHRKIVTKLGGSEVQEPSNCSILVADKVRRTFKFLCSLARGIPIVSVKWLDNSNKAKRFLNWEDYILKDLDAETKYGFNLKDSLEKAKNKKLLEEYTVLITPNIKEPPISELKEMVTLSGGKAIVRPPSKWSEKTVVVSKEENLLNAKKFIAKAPKSVSIYSTEFILTGILRQDENFVEFKLSV